MKNTSKLTFQNSAEKELSAERLLRRVIREHISDALNEEDSQKESPGVKELDPKAKEKLQMLADIHPSTLKAFSDDKITATSVEKSGQVEGFWTSIWTLPSRTWKGFANFFYPSLNTE